MNLLAAWIGVTDLAASRGEAGGVGPISAALASERFGEALLLADWPAAETDGYRNWIVARHPEIKVTIVPARLSQPNAFGEIYRAAVEALDFRLGGKAKPSAMTFHLSPGTPAMASVWLIISKTRYDAELIESSRDTLNTVTAPFDLAAELLPDLLKGRDKRLGIAAAEQPGTDAHFGDILYRSNEMARVVGLARKAAPRRVPVLIEGETGTGKELFARAIHAEGPRRSQPFIVLNCGAIPKELVESQLFGHRKGAFTGADKDHEGVFAAADGGTLFLDEIGELPLDAQVKMLRVLQESEVVRVGDTRARTVDVRMIAATHRTLIDEVAGGRFREDLFYRLGVLMLRLPPLREREGDLGHLIDWLLERVSDEMASEPGFSPKTLNAGARNILLRHDWPGNVRELQNTLRRLLVWTDGTVIQSEDVRDAILPSVASVSPAEVLGRSLGNGFDLDGVINEVARHYVKRAMAESGGNKSKAARLVGFASYQRFENWLKKIADE